jgi:hypothetical protein
MVDLVQRYFDLRRREARKRHFKQGISRGDAEQVGPQPLGPAHQAVKEYRLPGVFEQWKASRMRILLVGQLGSALTGGQGGRVSAADIGIEDGQEITAAGAAEDFVDSAGLAHIEMTGVDHGHVLLPAPQAAHSQSQDA